MPATDPAQVDAERFTKFKIMQPMHSPDAIKAAWQQAGGDIPKAEALLNNPTWRPNLVTPSPGKVSQLSNPETGRVKELDDAHKAQRARVREMGKKSLIYQSHVALDPKSPSQSSTPPTSKVTIDLTQSSPVVPQSPEVAQRPAKRPKRKVVHSDSEPEYVGSDEEGSLPTLENGVGIQSKTLIYFNTVAAEALQELSGNALIHGYVHVSDVVMVGCSPEQAKTIISLRPFSSVEDLNAKLGQGKKKAGPSGISPRLFEDCHEILQGYGKVDSILANCEKIGASLKREIMGWTSTGSTRLTGREGSASSRASPMGSDIGEDGSLSLRSQAVLGSKKPDYYISKQPSLLSETVQLKEYQLMGVNWLNLLYRKRLSCILADEMGASSVYGIYFSSLTRDTGLGKTVQVISFLAHLREQGCKGPHLIIVPYASSHAIPIQCMLPTLTPLGHLPWRIGSESSSDLHQVYPCRPTTQGRSSASSCELVSGRRSVAIVQEGGRSS